MLRAGDDVPIQRQNASYWLPHHRDVGVPAWQLTMNAVVNVANDKPDRGRIY